MKRFLAALVLFAMGTSFGCGSASPTGSKTSTPPEAPPGPVGPKAPTPPAAPKGVE